MTLVKTTAKLTWLSLVVLSQPDQDSLETTSKLSETTSHSTSPRTLQERTTTSTQLDLDSPYLFPDFIESSESSFPSIASNGPESSFFAPDGKNSPSFTPNASDSPSSATKGIKSPSFAPGGPDSPSFAPKGPDSISSAQAGPDAPVFAPPFARSTPSSNLDFAINQRVKLQMTRFGKKYVLAIGSSNNYRRGIKINWLDDVGGANQLFYLEKVWTYDGYWYILRSDASRKYCVDNKGGRTKGIGFHLYECNHSVKNQLFRPIAENGDKFMIQFYSSKGWNGVMEGIGRGMALSWTRNDQSHQWIEFVVVENSPAEVVNKIVDTCVNELQRVYNGANYWRNKDGGARNQLAAQTSANFLNSAKKLRMGSSRGLLQKMMENYENAVKWEHKYRNWGGHRNGYAQWCCTVAKDTFYKAHRELQALDQEVIGVPELDLVLIHGQEGGSIGTYSVEVTTGVSTSRTISSELGSSIGASIGGAMPSFSASVDVSLSATFANSMTVSSYTQKVTSIEVNLINPCYVYQIIAKCKTRSGDMFSIFGNHMIRYSPIRNST